MKTNPINPITKKAKIILDLCGGTGSWSRPYKENGYDVRLITLPDHDVMEYEPPEYVYGILAAPTCTHFSYARTTAVLPRDLETAMILVRRCLEIIWKCQYNLQNPNAKKTTLQFWALENPKGFLRFFLGQPALEFHPWEFGDGYMKQTDLWGNFKLPHKNEVEYVKTKFDRLNSRELPQLPEGFVYDKGCGLDKRQVRRSITPRGFASAFFKANS